MMLPSSSRKILIRKLQLEFQFRPVRVKEPLAMPGEYVDNDNDETYFKYK